MTMMPASPLRYTRVILLLLSVAIKSYRVVDATNEQQTCSEDDGACVETSTSCQVRYFKAESLYDSGATAQAYKPNAPQKSIVCENENEKLRDHRVASWLFSRSRRQRRKLRVHARFWTCPDEDDECCTPLTDVGGENSTKVEVWQSRPNGSYSALSPGMEEGECRATIVATPSFETGLEFDFETLVPGSTGILGGMGPGGMDFPPYGPPVIHMLIIAPLHEPLLVDLPIEVQRFRGPDLRGHAWVKPAKYRRNDFSTSALTIDSFEETSNEFQMEVSFFLRSTGDAESNEGVSFCTSSIYGTPFSFFVEPISVCGSSLLDFFPI